MVIVDSDVWSEAFRRNAGDPSASCQALEALIENDEIVMIGPIRQEILSGLRDAHRYDSIRKQMRQFPDLPIATPVYELAAGFFNTCRRNGVQGSHTDFLICACCVTWRAPILSKDRDYLGFKAFLPITLFDPS